MTASPSVQRRFAPWIILTTSILAVPIIFIGASALSRPSWDWSTSFFGHFIAHPLLVAALCVSIGASFFTVLPIGWRIALSVGALISFAGMVVGGWVLWV